MDEKISVNLSFVFLSLLYIILSGFTMRKELLLWNGQSKFQKMCDNKEKKVFVWFLALGWKKYGFVSLLLPFVCDVEECLGIGRCHRSRRNKPNRHAETLCDICGHSFMTSQKSKHSLLFSMSWNYERNVLCSQNKIFQSLHFNSKIMLIL